MRMLKQSSISNKKPVEDSQIWVIWPHGYKQKKVEKVVREYLALGYKLTIICDLPAERLPVTHLAGVEVNTLFRWLTPTNEKSIIRAAHYLGQTWFNTETLDVLLKWRGVRLGELLQRTLPNFSFIKAMRLIEGVVKWRIHRAPDAIVLFDRNAQFSMAVCQVLEKKVSTFIYSNGEGDEHFIVNLLHEIWLQMLWFLLDIRDITIRVVWAKLIHIYNRSRIENDGTFTPLAIVVGFDRNHYKHILPIAKHLSLKDWQIRILIGLTGNVFLPSASMMDVDFSKNTIDGYVTARVIAQFRLAKRLFRDVWKRLEQTGKLESRFEYLGFNIWPIVRSQLHYCFYIYLPTAIRYLELVWEIIDEETPSAFILGNDSCFRGHAIVAIARKRCVRTVVVQHGMTAEPWDYVPASDRMIVWGEQSRDAIVGWGAELEQLVCIGAPGLDHLVTLARDEVQLAQRRKLACRHLGIDNTNNLILMLSGRTLGEPQESFISIAFQVARDLCLEGRFVVKLHPSESGDAQERIANKMGIDPYFTRDVDLWGLIAASRMVITGLNSTAGVESLILNKPVIAVKTSEITSIYATSRELVYQVETVDELRTCMQLLLSERRKPIGHELEQLLGPLDGKAAFRAAEWIATLVLPKEIA